MEPSYLLPPQQKNRFFVLGRIYARVEKGATGRLSLSAVSASFRQSDSYISPSLFTVSTMISVSDGSVSLLTVNVLESAIRTLYGPEVNR